MIENEITRLADKLHKRFCNANHIDHCGWEYSSWADFEENQGYWSDKRKYYLKAKTLLDDYIPETIEKLFNELEQAEKHIKTLEKILKP